MLIGFLRQLANPAFDEFHRFGIDDVRRDVRHPAEADLLHPVQHHRAGRFAGDEDFRIGQLEQALSRTDADRACFGERQWCQSLSLGYGIRFAFARASFCDRRQNAKIVVERW